jgi:hypothetical protein
LYVLTTAHDDEIIEVQSSRGEHEKIKLIALVDCNVNKTDVDKSVQIQAYYLFHRESVKWWEKIFVNFSFNLTIVNACVLCKK